MPGTRTLRYDVANLDQWGRLIKSWATHLDYVSQASAPQPPRDYWVNKTWGATTPPAPATVLDIDAEHCGHAGCAVCLADEFPIVSRIAQIQRCLAHIFAVARDGVIRMERLHRRLGGHRRGGDEQRRYDET